MNKEELKDIICQSSSDYKILNEAYNYIEKLEQKIKKSKFYQQENKQLKDNWNKLKDIFYKGILDCSSGEIDQEMWLSSEILEIMQELEKENKK